MSAFMVPEYTRETFFACDNKYGEGQIMPANVMSRETFAEEHGVEAADVEVIEQKWWARLSAPGYMDCTEWHGPYATQQEARDEIASFYEVDPETGEDLEAP